MFTKSMKALEFSLMVQQLVQETITAQGRQLAEQIQPMSNKEEIERALDEVDAFFRLDEEGQRFPIFPLEEVSSATKRLSIQAPLNAKEFSRLIRLLRSADETSRFFKKIENLKDELSVLFDLAEEMETLPDLRRNLTRAMDDEGRLYDNASQELANLRRQIKTEEGRIHEELDNLLKSRAKYLSDQLVTIRNDRYVIPVKQEYSHQVPGVVHDQSASGLTLYIEPQSLVTRNNRIQSLKTAEKQEMDRLYREFSEETAPYREELDQLAQVLGHFDFISAKYRLAKKMKATRPYFSKDERSFDLKQAVHPMLDPKTAVHNDIYLRDGHSMLVITGPNTGGKSITLKTIGLLHEMGQAGLFITAAENSQIGLYDYIAIDIGDEQSIEANLSTFSSHMTNIISILEHTTSRSLVLIDELGSGTDPKEGAALAIAILDALASKQATVALTTHYPELKGYAYEHPDAINASVSFDDVKMLPTYHLHIGEPGKSNALQISSRLGLDQTIIEEARSFLSQDSQDLNAMIEDLDKSRRHYQQRERFLNQQLGKTNQLLHELREKYEELKKNKDRYLSKAKEEANKVTAQTQEEADEIIRELRNWQLNHGEGMIKEEAFIEKQQALENLKQDELNENKVLKKAKRERKEKESFHVGDEVEVTSYGQVGTLIENRGKGDWVVQMGMLKMELNESDFKAQQKKKERSFSQVRIKKSASVKPTLDLRGKRYEEAMMELDQYIDQALLAKYPQVTIIHGFGTGAIREGVQTYLKKQPQVDQFHYAAYNNGGNGATVVEFKA